jgi:hypothetical protein
MIPFHAVGDSYSQAVADLDDRIKGSPVVGHGLRFASIVLTVYTQKILDINSTTVNGAGASGSFLVFIF